MRSSSVRDYTNLSRNSSTKSPQSNKKSGGLFSIFSQLNATNKSSSRSKNRSALAPKEDTHKYKETKRSSLYHQTTYFLKHFFVFCGYFLSIPFIIFWNILSDLFQRSTKQTVTRDGIFKLAVVVIFGVLVFRFADLQVSTDSVDNYKRAVSTFKEEPIPSMRGNIYITNLEQKKDRIALTSSIPVFNIFINPLALKAQLAGNKEQLTLEEVAANIAGALNKPYQDIYNKLKAETEKDIKTIKEYVVIDEYAKIESKKAAEFLIDPPQNSLEDKSKHIIAYNTWLGIENKEIRTYNEGKLLANTLGYVTKYLVSKEDLASSKTPCFDVAKENEKRGTDQKNYTASYFGLEQKFCKELSGLNGKKVFNKDRGLAKEKEFGVVNGSNIHLTIDYNLQRRAEEILDQAMKDNTNPKVGAPANGMISIMDVKTGKILAMASNPTYNPNETNRIENVDQTRNIVTGYDYEVGSVMKPLTVAIARNEYEIGALDEKGERKGVPADWTGGSYDQEGKIYYERNKSGEITDVKNIRNADNSDYNTPQNLSNILRDSINTGIADIMPTIGNETMKDYMTNKLRLGTMSALKLPGDVAGNFTEFNKEKTIYCDVCFANYAFGQGIAISPIQLMRAYTPLANGGKLVEPYLYEKITDENGNVIDDGTGPNSIIPRKPAEQVFSPKVAEDVTQYLINTTEQGYHGEISPQTDSRPNGYYLAGKTGTAQMGHEGKYTGDCPARDFLACNTAKGIYDHTFVGYGPGTDPKYLIVIKLSEPRPGTGSKNFAVVTLSKHIKAMSEYTFEYMKLPHDRK